jgi:metal-responsive CopG/Arc/MetJ family transcriptional regulator
MRKWVSFRIREEMLRALDEFAERNGVSRSLLIKKALEEFLKNRNVVIEYKKEPFRGG